jgi:hypothetical protein
MPRPPVQQPTLDEHGDEVHPAFGKATINRMSSTPGSVLFDSEIRHGSTVRLSFFECSRKRDLNRDWLHATREVLEVEMSEAQWAALVSSFGNGNGVPVTLRRTSAQRFPLESTPEIPFEPRLALSTEETVTAADRAFEKIKAAAKAVEEKPTKANIRTLMNHIENAPRNIEFAAQSLTEHVENVVTKAKFDIESMVTAHAETLGLSAADMPVLELARASEDDGE